MASEKKHTPEPWGDETHLPATTRAGYLVRLEGPHAGDNIISVTETDFARATACVNACADINPAAVPVMVEALKDLLKRYRALVDSGDCGCWDSLDDDEVVNAIAALQLAGVTL